MTVDTGAFPEETTPEFKPLSECARIVGNYPQNTGRREESKKQGKNYLLLPCVVPPVEEGSPVCEPLVLELEPRLVASPPLDSVLAAPALVYLSMNLSVRTAISAASGEVKEFA